ncbi:velvet factor-domain-containing protein [Pseudoneurospora amorphoporcata]|uniref:Velvet factor-domain-containing protein n=1 Tax=Pseudoneurospora amorphoporcata TaxID=241081 RepID=A0AAN6SJH4_9PEZI|nr:velvet factor-domain-containing protein [Pseudoneurospora amorphoporcata]
MATSSPPSMDGMSPVYELKIRQQPKNARVAIGKEKADRKPIDPPPIIQLDIHPMRHQIHNPYLILVCKLVAPGSTENEDGNHQQPEPKENDLTGSLCSSPYVLKDTNNAQGLFFIFQDVSVRREGTYRLEFNLFELKPLTRECIALARTTSDKFVVFPHRYFPGMAESTFLTRSFSDQGVRIRLRKDSRSVSTRKRGVSALGVGEGSGGVVGRLRTGSTIGLGGQQYSPITISHHHSQSHGSGGGSHDELSPTSTSPIHRINTTLAGHHHHDLIPGIGHLDRGHHRGSLASHTSSSLLESPSNTMLTSPTVSGVGGFGASTATTTMGGSGNYSFTGIAAAQQYSYPGAALSLTTGATADDRYYDYSRASKRPRLLHGVDDSLDHHSYGRNPYGRDPYDHHHREVGSVTLPPHTQGYATMDTAHGYHGRHHDYYGATAAGAYFGSGM